MILITRKWLKNKKNKKIESATVTDVINGDRSKEVQDMQKRIVDFRDNAQKNYNKRI
jgi:outer membrane protein